MTSPWWTRVAVDPAAVAGLFGVTVWYLRGHRQRPRTTSSRRRSAAFLAGVAATLAAAVGPLPAGSEVLLWVHVVEHLLLTVVAAPLLALGSPVATLRLGLSAPARRRLAGVARRTRRWRRRAGDPPALVVAAVVHVVATWTWHVPALYDLAVRVPAVHALEHVVLLGSALWFWAEVVATARRSRRDQALATVCLAGLIATGGVLGALLTFAGRPLYGAYDGAGGLSALEDQQLGGALLWVLPSFVYATVALRRFTSWLDRSEAELRAREARERDRRGRHGAGATDVPVRSGTGAPRPAAAPPRVEP